MSCPPSEFFQRQTHTMTLSHRMSLALKKLCAALGAKSNPLPILRCHKAMAKFLPK
jgi:hypothetical protein